MHIFYKSKWESDDGGERGLFADRLVFRGLGYAMIPKYNFKGNLVVVIQEKTQKILNPKKQWVLEFNGLILNENLFKRFKFNYYGLAPTQ